MVHSSNPRLMNRVLDAVVHLCDGKGSTARGVLDYLRHTSKGTPRNLTMQVHRALKHAVNAGLLRHRSGRYKALFTLNPAPIKQPVLNESNEGRSVAGTTAFDTEQSPSRGISDRREENRGKHRRSRHDRKRKRSRSHQRKRRRSSGSRRREDGPTEYMGEVRKYKYKEKGGRDRSPRRKNINKRMKMDVASTSTCNHKRSRRKPKDEEYYSDASDSSEYEEVDTKPRTQARQESKYDGSGKQSRRSVSRNRSPQRQQSQQLQAKRSRDDVKSNKVDSDDRRNGDPNDEPDQDADKDHEPNNSGSGSTL